MNVLGIETSCDETSAAIVTNGRLVRANIIAGQADLYARCGGVVPEVASRKRVERMLPVVPEILDAAGRWCVAHAPTRLKPGEKEEKKRRREEKKKFSSSEKVSRGGRRERPAPA